MLLAYGLAANGFQAQALAVAEAITHLLANDLQACGSWHENYNSDTGEPLAAPEFLSWNVLAADLLGNVHAGINPFALRKP